MNYVKCVGLTLLSWDYPKGNGININIDQFERYPITTMITLTKREKDQLIAKDVILTNELEEKPNILVQLKISTIKYSAYYPKSISSATCNTIK